MAPRKRKPVTSWAAKLKAAQERLGLDNEEMAKRLGTSLRTYLSWKYGERTPARFTQALVLNQIK